MDIIKVIQVIRNEKECIKRQGDMTKCKRHEHEGCLKCDLCLPDNDILEAYDFVLKIVEGIAVDSLTIIVNGMALYLTDGHIEALKNYERDQILKEMCDRIKSSFDEMPSAEFMKKFNLPLKPLDNGIVRLKTEGDTD